MSFIDISMPLVDGASLRPGAAAILAREKASIREAALGLGRTIILGALAVTALSGHELFACEHSQAPKSGAASAATVRKPGRILPLDKWRAEPRRESWIPAIPTRRIILQ